MDMPTAQAVTTTTDASPKMAGAFVGCRRCTGSAAPSPASAAAILLLAFPLREILGL
jgi:hypothetical protein